MTGWADAFVHAMDNPQSWTTSHQRGIASVSGRKIILEPTTIEQVREDHKATLEAAVQFANQHVAAMAAKEAEESERSRLVLEEHKRHVAAEAAKISF